MNISERICYQFAKVDNFCRQRVSYLVFETFQNGVSSILELFPLEGVPFSLIICAGLSENVPSDANNKDA